MVQKAQEKIDNTGLKIKKGNLWQLPDHWTHRLS